MSELTVKEKASIFPYSKWENDLPNSSGAYRSSQPYRHAVLDDFLDPEVASKALNEFPPINSEEWTNYTHVNENKYGQNDFTSFTHTIKGIINELNSDRFVQYLTDLTKIKGLFADPTLEGGGLHQSPRGGFLNVHADFTVHPHHHNWQRRVNVLVYLNKDWNEAYGGHLELWDKEIKACVKRILPVFNRVVIFNTDEDSYHGHPTPMDCPEHVTRKSIALYYFTKESKALRIRSTEYRARPQDGIIKGVFIYMDKMILRVYDRIKRTFGLNDKFASHVLRFFSKK